jgi:hypothetical protein
MHFLSIVLPASADAPSILQTPPDPLPPARSTESGPRPSTLQAYGPRPCDRSASDSRGRWARRPSRRRVARLQADGRRSSEHTAANLHERGTEGGGGGEDALVAGP